MSVDNAKALITQAQLALNNALTELGTTTPAPVPSATLITTAAQLDAALAAAPTGALLKLGMAFVYPSALTLTKPVTLQAEVVGVGRMTRAEAAPSFQGGIRGTADDIHLVGLDVRHPSPLTDIVVLHGARSVFDRVRVLGDPIKGAKRGIAANGTAMAFYRCFVDDVWQPAQDTQAIGTWDMGGGLMIDDCYLSSGAQAFMAGGADPSGSARSPHDIIIQNSTLTKNPAWYGIAQIKCALELKNAVNVHVNRCQLEYAGISMGQGGYLIVLTPRNQGGTAPFSSVEKVLIENCDGRFGAGIMNMLGSDNNNPSGPLADITLRDSRFSDIDPLGITKGAGRLFMFDRAPKNIALSNLSVTGANIAALGYFSGAAPTGFKAGLLSLPPSKYGWKINAGGSGHAALQAFMPDAQLDSTIV